MLVGRAVTRLSLEWGGLRFKSQAGQIGKMLPTVRRRCNISLKGTALPRSNDAEMGPQTRYTIRRNTASITIDLVFDR